VPRRYLECVALFGFPRCRRDDHVDVLQGLYGLDVDEVRVSGPEPDSEGGSPRNLGELVVSIPEEKPEGGPVEKPPPTGEGAAESSRTEAAGALQLPRDCRKRQVSGELPVPGPAGVAQVVESAIQGQSCALGKV
jgi:hypothetical protein